jgi:outer membrane protein assembly factor BamB/beta-lactamase regulating signal transducer with metallopeptidase domain
MKQAVTHLTEEPSSLRAAGAPISMPSILLGLWAGGVLLAMIRGTRGWIRAGRICLSSKELLQPDIHPILAPLLSRSGCRVSPRFRVSQELSSPALIGFSKPVILVPPEAEEASIEATSSAIAHELAHLKRRDMAWLLLAEVVKAVFWFHPFVWIACREQRAEAEIAADDLARKWTEASPKDYATHLLEWVDLSRISVSSQGAGPGLLSATHELTRRINSMATPRYRRSSVAALAACFGLPLALGFVPVALVAPSGQGLARSPWPKVGGIPNSGAQEAGSGAIGVPKWTFYTGGNVTMSSAIAADGTVFVGSDSFKVFALDGKTGAKKWSFPTGANVHSSPSIGRDGTVFVGCDTGVLYALDGRTGAKKWDFKTGGRIESSPAIAEDGTVYAGSYDGKMYAIDGATGSKKWSFETSDLIYASPALGANRTVYFGAWDGNVYALDGATGAKKWSFKAGNHAGSPVIGMDGTVYVGSWDQNLYALDGATGAKKWAFATGGHVDYPVIGADGTVYIGSFDHNVYALDGATGAQKWSFRTGDQLTHGLALGSDGTLYVGGLDGNLYALDGRTGAKRWSVPCGSIYFSAPAIASDGTIYVGSLDWKVHAIR